MEYTAQVSYVILFNRVSANIWPQTGDSMQTRFKKYLCTGNEISQWSELYWAACFISYTSQHFPQAIIYT